MRVFLSWSGPASLHIAKGLRDWLPNVLQTIEPWLSKGDIEKGARWNSALATTLGECKAGVICLTHDNLVAPWILFEAGALAKTLDDTFVCPYLYRLKPADLDGPLSAFQATIADKVDTLGLIHTINRASNDRMLPRTVVEAAFEKWWPDLEAVLATVPEGERTEGPARSDRALLEELLVRVREIGRHGDDTSRLSARVTLVEGSAARGLSPLEPGISDPPVLAARQEMARGPKGKTRRVGRRRAKRAR